MVRRVNGSVAGGNVASTQELTISLAKLGTAIGTAIKQAVGREYDHNAVVITLFLLDLRGPMRPHDLAVELGFTSGGVSKLLARMELLGVIQRFDHTQTDLRAVSVRLTPAGRRVSRKIAGAAREAMDAAPAISFALERIGDGGVGSPPA